jgi:hypothetical protein
VHAGLVLSGRQHDDAGAAVPRGDVLPCRHDVPDAAVPDRALLWQRHVRAAAVPPGNLLAGAGHVRVCHVSLWVFLWARDVDAVVVSRGLVLPRVHPHRDAVPMPPRTVQCVVAPHGQVGVHELSAGLLLRQRRQHERDGPVQRGALLPRRRDGGGAHRRLRRGVRGRRRRCHRAAGVVQRHGGHVPPWPLVWRRVVVPDAVLARAILVVVWQHQRDGVPVVLAGLRVRQQCYSDTDGAVLQQVLLPGRPVVVHRVPVHSRVVLCRGCRRAVAVPWWHVPAVGRPGHVSGVPRRLLLHFQHHDAVVVSRRLLVSERYRGRHAAPVSCGSLLGCAGADRGDRLHAVQRWRLLRVCGSYGADGAVCSGLRVSRRRRVGCPHRQRHGKRVSRWALL